ncbi:hypothetical protein CRX59_00565 [Burkholderia thailandensis]|nr:hypothetical protein CRX59_00565 [Burkholderia thailandensis]PNE82388.1 hypothetical protein A8H34_32505 [Burkholderia thailandensis]PNE88330.1 hypothetical protein A8H30_32165 [Burkholderia thailandensis]
MGGGLSTALGGRFGRSWAGKARRGVRSPLEWLFLSNLTDRPRLAGAGCPMIAKTPGTRRRIGADPSGTRVRSRRRRGGVDWRGRDGACACAGPCPRTSCPFGTCPFGTCPFGTCPFGTCPFGTCPFGTCPFGTCPFGTCPFGTCPFGTCASATCASATCAFETCPFAMIDPHAADDL